VRHDIVEQVLLDYNALRQPDADSELEAVRAAILLEDVFSLTLSDNEIDAAVLTDPSATAALVARLRGAV
jgi:hypothetical protein